MKKEENTLPLQQTHTNIKKPQNYFKVIKTENIYLISGVLVNENTKLCYQK